MFETVINLLDNAIALDEGFAFDFAINSRISDKIIELNTIEQLYEDGIDSKGKDLGLYSDFTIEIKILKNDRFDHVTLKDTGDFYNSFRVTADRGEITISADDSSKYDAPLSSFYGKDIIGLTDENLQIVIDLIRPRIITYVELKLCA
jgi:hypothetical protein